MRDEGREEILGWSQGDHKQETAGKAENQEVVVL